MANNLVDGIPLFGTRFSKTILTSFAVTPGAGTLITEADLQAGLKMYNVTLREADAVAGPERGVQQGRLLTIIVRPFT